MGAGSLKPAKCANMLDQNYFAEPKWHILTFFIQFERAGSHTEHRWRMLSGRLKELVRFWLGARN
jgi:hypothetical protein